MNHHHLSQIIRGRHRYEIVSAPHSRVSAGYVGVGGVWGHQSQGQFSMGKISARAQHRAYSEHPGSQPEEVLESFFEYLLDITESFTTVCGGHPSLATLWQLVFEPIS